MTLRRAPFAAALAALIGAAVLPARAAAGGGAFRESAHGNKETGVRRVPGLPRGECGHCHGAAGEPSGKRGDGGGHAKLFLPNDNSLCLGCHLRPGESWQGELRYGDSAHGRSPAAVWPGPVPAARSPSDAGKCVNCHDPHGAKDRSGIVPALLRSRGTASCLTCHRGDPAADVASSFSRPYRHPLAADPPTMAVPSSAGMAAAPVNAAAAGDPTCSACHNPHVAGQDVVRPIAAGALRSLLGVARVRPAGPAAGATRTFTLVRPSEAGSVWEYEVCYKCHSAASRRPGLGLDLAGLLNPANRSYHPVEAQGRNRTIERRSFTQSWNADRLVTCSDCHGSDDETQRGPHGSSNAHILRRPQPTGMGGATVQETDLCFTCHAWKTYGESKSAAAYSRWTGHGSHSSKGITCWTCHDSHGSATLPGLLVLRPSGLASFSQEPAGGTCATSCHSRTAARIAYRASYAR